MGSARPRREKNSMNVMIACDGALLHKDVGGSVIEAEPPISGYSRPQ